VRIIYEVDTKDFPGLNILFLEFNPGFDQPEQYHFNNFIFKNVYVRPDLKNPLLDVTFDGIHILNRDIVSSKPNIVIKLKDEAKFMLLNDTSLTSVQVRYPDQNNTLKTFNFNTDTVRFIPAASASDNTATVEFRPYFPQILDANGQPLNPNGDEYELIVKGKDRSGNKAGNLEYRVTFKVIDKPMISNLLNYPNPFTTSTAFVFTLTGSEIPTNMKIQILTVTGKIVREITRDELGPIHIGRNITEFKWDGTDQYGQKLANGVYLYRVVTSLNGKNLEKYKATGDNTDKFFNNGYGKMYLMR
jgi:flagellar hook assembly protein FlgD